MSSFLFKVQLPTGKAWRYVYSAVLVFCLHIWLSWPYMVQAGH